jgi:hypothetical protein
MSKHNNDGYHMQLKRPKSILSQQLFFVREKTNLAVTTYGVKQSKYLRHNAYAK